VPWHNLLDIPCATPIGIISHLLARSKSDLPMPSTAGWHGPHCLAVSFVRPKARVGSGEQFAEISASKRVPAGSLWLAGQKSRESPRWEVSFLPDFYGVNPVG
jgi:hypothetical protein